jgi:hypothetical protein
MFDLKLIDFVSEVKEIYGSCSILDSLEPEDIPSFAKFTKIVWNYNKMKEINEEANSKN